MPKVSKIKLFLESAYGENYDVWYNAKGKPGFSITGLPIDFTSVTDFYPSGFNTEIDLSNAVHAAVTRYKEAKKTSKKVIIYSASASTELTHVKTCPGQYSAINREISKKLGSINGENASFGLTYSVRMEVDHTNHKKYHEIKEDGSLGWSTALNGKSQVMDWTPEREQFFENIYNSMRAMVLKVSGFIEQDPETASILIDSKQKLLG